GELLRREARERLDAAARAERLNQADRLRGIGLRLRSACCAEENRTGDTARHAQPAPPIIVNLKSDLRAGRGDPTYFVTRTAITSSTSAGSSTRSRSRSRADRDR